MTAIEIAYRYHPDDFRLVYRLLRPIANRATCVAVAYLLLSMAPSMALLAWQGVLPVAAPFVAAAMLAVFWGRRGSKSQLRQQFRTLCLDRKLCISDEMFETEWRHGWFRCHWSAFSRVAAHRGWLVLYRRDAVQPAGLLPPAAVKLAREQYGVDLQAHLQRLIQQSPRDEPLRCREEGRALAEVDFAMTPEEIAIIAERSFHARGAKQTPAWVFVLSILAAIAVLLVVPSSTSMQNLARQALIPALVLPLALAALAPWKRRLFGAVLGDQTLQQQQTIVVRDSGIEQRQAHEQVLARWPQVATIVDAQRFIACYTHHGGLACVPRRAFADGADDAFLQQARQAMEQQRQREAESETAVDLETQRPLVDSGNPYQPPGSF